MRNQIYSRGNVSEKSTVKTYYIQAEYTRRWLGYHDKYDTYRVQKTLVSPKKIKIKRK